MDGVYVYMHGVYVYMHVNKMYSHNVQARYLRPLSSFSFDHLI